MHEENNTYNPLLKNVKPPFKQSKEEIWNEMFENLEEAKETKIIQFKPLNFGIAASITLFILFGLTAKFYTKTVISDTNNQLTHILPDGSTVNLNAETQLSYHPYWWNFEREVKMEGEAFFEVEKGSKFSVISSLGRTSVLGTSFNINSRHGYEVVCKTGKVKVESHNQETLLTPNQKVKLAEGTLIKSELNNIKIQWMNGEFEFTSEKLKYVFEEIERQYGIDLQYNSTIGNKVYTGFFNKNKNIDTTLSLICESFELNFKKDKNTYIVHN